MGRDGRLAGKVAIITGGGGDICAAIARAFAAEGARLVLVDKEEESSGRVGAALADDGHDVLVEIGDVTDASLATAVVERTSGKWSAPNVLVNGAAIRTFHSFLDLEDAVALLHYEVNVIAPLRWTQAVARKLVASGKSGSVINVTSVVASRAFPANAAYAASKAALASMTRSAALDLGEHTIRVNSIAPGPTRTRLTAELLADGAVAARLEERIPLGRIGEVDDVAGAAVYLASDESAFVTGTTLSVDGGYLIA